jgi:colanic acid/amylovoran biosynthesis glycosyltransferase
MQILHFLETYLPLTESWIYPQIIGNGQWKSIVGCFFCSNKKDYPFDNVISFSDYWPVFKSGIGKKFIYHFPSLCVTWMNKIFNGKSFDILHCHFGNYGYYALPLKKKLKLPMITMFYGYDATKLPQEDKKWYHRYNILFESGDLFLVEGQHMKKTLIELGCPEEKIKIFHLGVDVENIVFRPKEFKLGETFKILAAGTFREKKGIPYAIEAFALAKKNILK